MELTLKQIFYLGHIVFPLNVLVCFLFVSAIPAFADSHYKLVNLGLLRPIFIQDDGVVFGNGGTSGDGPEVLLHGHLHKFKVPGLPQNDLSDIHGCDGNGTAVGTYTRWVGKDLDMQDLGEGIVVWKNSKPSLIKCPAAVFEVADPNGVIYTTEEAGVRSWIQTRHGWIYKKITISQVTAANNGTAAGIVVPVLTMGDIISPCFDDYFGKIAFINPVTRIQRSLIGKLGSVECITRNGWMCGSIVVSGNKPGAEVADGFIAHNNDLGLIHINNAKWVMVQSVNIFGDAVGYFGTKMTDCHGFLLKHGSTTPQLVQLPRCRIFALYGINKRGVIIGYASFRNEPDAKGIMLKPTK